MNTNIFRMSMPDIGLALLIGFLCALIYMLLLWKTVKTLPFVKHKGSFLFISAALRIFLLLACMILFSNHQAGRFITIFCGFVITRLIILHINCFGKSYKTQNKEITKSMTKKKGRK